MPENVPYAREVLNALPTSPTPATDYFIRQADGRIEHWISDLAAPHTLRPVSFNVAVAGAPPPTDVTRTGALTSTQTYGSLASARQRFRPTVNIPVTGVQVDQITVSGSAAVAFHDLTTGQWVAAAAASQVGAGITSPVSAQLLAGHEYFLHVGTLGSGVTGTEYTGAVSGVAFSSGHTWTGLTLTAPPSVFESATPVTAGAQLAFQLLTGDMTGFDPSGVTHKAENGATIAYDGATRTYTHGVSLDLSQWGASSTSSTDAFTGTATGTTGGPPFQRFDFTAMQSCTVSGVTFAGAPSASGGTLAARVGVGGSETPAVIDGATVTFDPLALTQGAPWSLYLDHVGSYASFPDEGVGAITSGGTIRFDHTNVSQDGVTYVQSSAESDVLPHITFTLGTPALYGVLPAAAFPGLGDLEAQVADHAGRITALEARPTLTAEYVQDIVGAMIPGATYDDAAGTLTLPAGQTADPENIRDLVAAFAVAGTGVTITHNDAGDTLTISATGGSLPAPGATGNVLTSSGGVWVSAPPPAGGDGGSGGPVALATGYAALESSPPGFTYTGEAHANAYGQYMDLRFQALTALTFRQLQVIWKTVSYGGNVTITVYRTNASYDVTTGTQLASVTLPVPAYSYAPGTIDFGTDVVLAAGEHLVWRVNGTTNGGLVYFQGATAVGAPLSMANGALQFAGLARQNGEVTSDLPNVSFLGGVTKGVLGPLDPADFPLTTAAKAPNNSGFMVVDDAAKTASLYWKFSDGSTKKVDLA